MSRNAQNPEDEEPLLPPLTISQTLTRVSLLACLGVGTIMFLKSQMVARQHLSRTSKVAETIANCHNKATERLIRENERGVSRIVEVLREGQRREGMRGMRGGFGGGKGLGSGHLAKMEGMRFDDEYGKWNGYSSTGNDGGGGGRIGFKVDGMREAVGKKAEGVRFDDEYGKWNGYSRHDGGGSGRIGFKVDGMRFKDKYPYGLGTPHKKAEGMRFQDHYWP